MTFHYCGWSVLVLVVMHLSMLCPTTPCAGSVGGFVGGFWWRTPQGGRGLVAHSMNLHANAHAYIPCDHSEWTSRTRYLLVHLQTLSGSQNRVVSFHGGTSLCGKDKG